MTAKCTQGTAECLLSKCSCKRCSVNRKWLHARDTETEYEVEETAVNPGFTAVFLYLPVEKPVDTVENLCIPNRKIGGF